MGSRKTPSLLRMHTRADGRPKEALSRPAAARARARGMHTYLCPLCGKCHAGNPR